MGNPLAQKTFTVRKIINGKSLTFSLQVDKALTQVYQRDNKAFAPDFGASPLTITPLMLVSGLQGDQSARVSGFKWTLTKENGEAATQKLTAVAGSARQQLKANLTDCTSLQIKCEATYTDPVSRITAPVVATVTLTKLENTGANIQAIAYAPLGDTLTNADKQLKIHCDLWRGGDIDSSSVAYTWAMLVGGQWKDLTAASNYGVSGYTSNEITVPASAITNVGIFRCSIKDTDPGSGTYNKTASTVYTLYDGTDPYEIDVFTPDGEGIDEGGTKEFQFKIRQGSSYVTELAFLKAHSMRVWRYASNREMDTTWGSGGYKPMTIDEAKFLFKVNITYADLLSATQAFCAEFM